jgi:GNAT superfamily N-acetyltransferase
MVVIREAVSDEDLEAWRQVFTVVVPNERALSVAEMRGTARRDLLRVLAEEDGAVVGSGIAGRSDFPDASSVAPRVLPVARRRGVGTELLRSLARHVESLGVSVVNANVDDAVSVAFAERFGFREIDRQVEQVRAIGDEPEPGMPGGIEIVSVRDRPEVWRQAYDTLAAQAFADMALIAPIEATLDEWEVDWISAPEAMFVALAGDQVVGCAGLMLDTDQPDRAENALTAVRRDFRGRGVASALKRTTLAWASRNGIREVYTWTQRGNADMRQLNEHLGYVTRSESLSMRATLPLNI